MIEKKLIIAIHKRLIAQFGGIEGVRDDGLLDSALAHPQHKRVYDKDADVFDLTASLCYALIKNHPFVDGNKRVGAVVCEFVLIKNGYEIKATEEEKYVIFMGVAAGEITEEELSVWLSENVK